MRPVVYKAFVCWDLLKRKSVNCKICVWTRWMEQHKCFLCNVVASQGSFLPPLGCRFPDLAKSLKQVSLWEHASEVLNSSVALWNCAVHPSCCHWIFQLPDSKWAASSVPFMREESSWALGPFVLGCFDSFCVQNIDKRDVFKINKSSGNRVQNWPCLHYSDHSSRVHCVAVNHILRLELDSLPVTAAGQEHCW